MTRGLGVVLGLAMGLPACGGEASRADAEAEAARRELYARAVSVDGGMVSQWDVSSSRDIHYKDGFSLLLHDPPDNPRGHAFRWMGPNAYLSLRTHGDHPMRLKVAGWCHLKEMRTRPVVSAYLDGQLVASTGVVGEDGLWGMDVTVQPPLFRGKAWVGLTLVTSAVAYHWGEVPDLRVVVLNALSWADVP